MQKFLSTAPVFTFIVFTFLAALLIELNRIFPDIL